MHFFSHLILLSHTLRKVRIRLVTFIFLKFLNKFYYFFILSISTLKVLKLDDFWIIIEFWVYPCFWNAEVNNGLSVFKFLLFWSHKLNYFIWISNGFNSYTIEGVEILFLRFWFHFLYHLIFQVKHSLINITQLSY